MENRRQKEADTRDGAQESDIHAGALEQSGAFDVQKRLRFVEELAAGQRDHVASTAGHVTDLSNARLEDLLRKARETGAGVHIPEQLLEKANIAPRVAVAHQVAHGAYEDAARELERLKQVRERRDRQGTDVSDELSIAQKVPAIISEEVPATRISETRGRRIPVTPAEKGWLDDPWFDEGEVEGDETLQAHVLRDDVTEEYPYDAEETQEVAMPIDDDADLSHVFGMALRKYEQPDYSFEKRLSTLQKNRETFAAAEQDLLEAESAMGRWFKSKESRRKVADAKGRLEEARRQYGLAREDVFTYLDLLKNAQNPEEMLQLVMNSQTLRRDAMKDIESQLFDLHHDNESPEYDRLIDLQTQYARIDSKMHARIDWDLVFDDMRQRSEKQYEKILAHEDIALEKARATARTSKERGVSGDDTLEILSADDLEEVEIKESA